VGVRPAVHEDRVPRVRAICRDDSQGVRRNPAGGLFFKAEASVLLRHFVFFAPLFPSWRTYATTL